MTSVERLRWFIEVLTSGGEVGDELEALLMPHHLPHADKIRADLATRGQQVAGARVDSAKDLGHGRALGRMTTPDGKRWTVAVSTEERSPHRILTMWSGPYVEPPKTDTITTERLLLRPMEQADLPACIEMESDEEIMRWIGAGGAQDADRTRARFEHMWWLPERFGTRAFTIVDRATDAFLGRVFLGPLLDDIEIGYVLVKDAWGRGLATEAARATVEWGFSHANLKRVVGITYPDNLASQKVLQKCGLVRAGEREIIGHTFHYFERVSV